MSNNLIYAATIIARQQSSRFPGKVIVDFDGDPLIVRIAKRVALSTELDKIIFCIPNSGSEELSQILRQFIIESDDDRFCIFYGDHVNVLNRVTQAMIDNEVDFAIRVNSDCPFVDYRIIDGIIKKHFAKNNQLDFISTKLLKRRLPYGLDIELFSLNLAIKVEKNASSDDKEHVTSGMLSISETIECEDFNLGINNPNFQLTIDTQEDLLRMIAIDKLMSPYQSLHILDRIDYLKKQV
jgi:spore coat polysaccharide biosynthesis protein SpsF